MDLHSALRTFVRASETLSFSAVASERGTTQSAVSRQVAALEDYYGVRLIHRTTRRLALTEDGRDLLGHAHKLLETAEAAKAAMAARGGEVTGAVRLLVPVTLALWLSDRLGPLLRKHPGLQLDVVAGDAYHDPSVVDYDLVVFSGHVQGASMVGKRLHEVGSALVGAPGFLDGLASAPAHPDDLAGYACLTHGTHAGRVRPVWEFEGAADETIRVDVPSRLHVGTSEFARHAALQGDGLAMLPWPLVHEDVAAGRLRIVMPQWRPPTVVLHAAYPSRRHLAPRTRAVLDFLAEEFRTAERAGSLLPASAYAQALAGETAVKA